MPLYFILTTLYFWVPVLAMWFYLRNKLDPHTKKAFWWSMVILAPATFVMEYVFLWADVWSFSEQTDPLLGIWIGGAPLEEFLFWFGAAPFILLVYFSFERLIYGRTRR